MFLCVVNDVQQCLRFDSSPSQLQIWGFSIIVHQHATYFVTQIMVIKWSPIAETRAIIAYRANAVFNSWFVFSFYKLSFIIEFIGLRELRKFWLASNVAFWLPQYSAVKCPSPPPCTLPLLPCVVMLQGIYGIFPIKIP